MTLSWLGTVLTLIVLTAVVGLVEAAIRRAPRVTDWFGIAIGALAGLATTVAVIWLASP